MRKPEPGGKGDGFAKIVQFLWVLSPGQLCHLDRALFSVFWIFFYLKIFYIVICSFIFDAF